MSNSSSNFSYRAVQYDEQGNEYPAYDATPFPTLDTFTGVPEYQAVYPHAQFDHYYSHEQACCGIQIQNLQELMDHYEVVHGLARSLEVADYPSPSYTSYTSPYSFASTSTSPSPTFGFSYPPSPVDAFAAVEPPRSYNPPRVPYNYGALVYGNPPSPGSMLFSPPPGPPPTLNYRAATYATPQVATYTAPTAPTPSIAYYSAPGYYNATPLVAAQPQPTRAESQVVLDEPSSPRPQIPLRRGRGRRPAQPTEPLATQGPVGWAEPGVGSRAYYSRSRASGSSSSSSSSSRYLPPPPPPHQFPPSLPPLSVSPPNLSGQRRKRSRASEAQDESPVASSSATTLEDLPAPDSPTQSAPSTGGRPSKKRRNDTGLTRHSPAELKPFKCPRFPCKKAYLNPNGLLYHVTKGTFRHRAYTILGKNNIL